MIQKLIKQMIQKRFKHDSNSQINNSDWRPNPKAQNPGEHQSYFNDLNPDYINKKNMD